MNGGYKKVHGAKLTKQTVTNACHKKSHASPRDGQTDDSPIKINGETGTVCVLSVQMSCGYAVGGRRDMEML